MGNPTLATEKRLMAYAAGAAGTLVMSQGVDAALVVKTVEASASGGQTNFDLGVFDNNASDFTFSTAAGATYDFAIYSSFDRVEFVGDVNDDNSNTVTLEFRSPDGDVAVNHAVGESVSNASGPQQTGSVYIAKSPTRQFQNGFAEGVRDYSGFVVFVGMRTHYGWFDFTANNDGSSTLHRFAIETTASTPALITAVPEPAHTAAVFALGAAGLAAYRRRRNASQQA